MKIIKKNKGFTLIELIIVIAIIGILAAVLIPSISGYIDKAHRGRDVELAGQMTTEISLYAAKYDVDLNNLTGVDVRTILSFSGQNLVPRKDNWVFVFDRTTHQVIVKDINEDGTILSIFNHNIIVDDDSESETFKPIDPTHIDNNYFLISKGNNNIEKAVELMTNLKTDADYTSAVNLLTNTVYLPIIKQFDPTTTMFIGNSGTYTTATEPGTVKKIVVLEQTSNLPKVDDTTYAKLDATLTGGDLVFSSTIRTSEPGSQLKNLFNGVVDIDLTKVKTIDLAAFGSYKKVNEEDEEDKTIYKMEMGPHIINSYKQDITDEILSIIKKGNNDLIINRKLTISYYNQDGLFARGSVYYAVLQKKPEASEAHAAG